MAWHQCAEGAVTLATPVPPFTNPAPKAGAGGALRAKSPAGLGAQVRKQVEGGVVPPAAQHAAWG